MLEIINNKSFWQLRVTHLPPETSLFLMKAIFIGSYRTIEEHYTVISQELSVLNMSS